MPLIPSLLRISIGTLVVSVVSASTIAPPPVLTLQNVPAVSAELVNEVARYTESRSAGFSDWHPERVEMLISTRFANSAQLHNVAMPGGARRQLTFFPEPVTDGSFDPVAGEFIIYSRDIGGGEFSQLFRMDFADGRSTLLTDGAAARIQCPRGARTAVPSPTLRHDATELTGIST